MDPVAVLRWSVAAIAIGAAGYHSWHAIRASRTRRPGLDVDLTHAAMGVGMAAMLVINLDAVTLLVLVAAFAITTLWYVVRTIDLYVETGARPAGVATRQLLCSVVMTGMLAVALLVGGHSMAGGHGVTAGAASHSGHVGAIPGLSTTASMDPRFVVLALLAVQVVVVAWTARALLPRPTTHTGAQLAIGVSGVAMLALMV